MAPLKKKLNEEVRKARQFEAHVKSGNPSFDWANTQKHVGLVAAAINRMGGVLQPSDHEIVLLSNTDLTNRLSTERLTDMLQGFMSNASQAEGLATLNTNMFDLHQRGSQG